MGRTNRIADKDVPVEDGETITLRFSGGENGPSDAGEYVFWSLFSESQVDTTRSRRGEEPGHRWQQMKDDPKYADGWAVAKDAVVIRPATEERAIKWLNRHPKDAAFAESGQIGSRPVRVVRTVSYRFESAE